MSSSARPSDVLRLSPEGKAYVACPGDREAC
jgi:hypothetical protein